MFRCLDLMSGGCRPDVAESVVLPCLGFSAVPAVTLLFSSRDGEWQCRVHRRRVEKSTCEAPGVLEGFPGRSVTPGTA